MSRSVLEAQVQEFLSVAGFAMNVLVAAAVAAQGGDCREEDGGGNAPDTIFHHGGEIVCDVFSS